MHEQPLILGALGLAAGALIGAALPASEAENRLVGDARDRAFEKAKQAGGEGYHKVRERADVLTEKVKQRFAEGNGGTQPLDWGLTERTEAGTDKDARQGRDYDLPEDSSLAVERSATERKTQRAEVKAVEGRSEAVSVRIRANLIVASARAKAASVRSTAREASPAKSRRRARLRPSEKLSRRRIVRRRVHCSCATVRCGTFLRSRFALSKSRAQYLQLAQIATSVSNARPWTSQFWLISNPAMQSPMSSPSKSPKRSSKKRHKTSILTIRDDVNVIVELKKKKAAPRLQSRRVVRRRPGRRGDGRCGACSTCSTCRTRAAAPARSFSKRTRRYRKSCSRSSRYRIRISRRSRRTPTSRPAATCGCRCS